jgi:hypothetical protein
MVAKLKPNPKKKKLNRRSRRSNLKYKNEK